MKKTIVAAMLVAFSAPAHADGLGDFILNITRGPTSTHAAPLHRHQHKKTPHGPHTEGASLHGLVNEVAAEHHLRPSLVHAVVKIESSYDCGASNHGAIGIMQVKQATAASVGVYGNLRDCHTGLEAGVRYLKQSIAMYGDGCVAYSAYNTGLGVASCTGYGRRVLILSRR